MNRKNRIFFHLGPNFNSSLVDKLLKMNTSIKFVESALFPEIKIEKSQLSKYKNKITYFDINLLTNSHKISVSKKLYIDQFEIMEKVLSDKLIPLLWTRAPFLKRLYNLSETKRYEVLISLVIESIRFIKENNPSTIIFGHQPHSLESYLLKKTINEFQIPNFTMVVSPFTWRMFVEKSNSETDLKNSFNQDKNLIKNKNIEAYLVEKKSNYRSATPFYENNENFFVSKFLQHIKMNGWNPNRIIKSSLAKRFYLKNVSKREQILRKDYLVFFLPVQPELSTLPDAGLFANQFFAIQLLYHLALKLDLCLVIREHPSTYRWGFDPKWRSREFYESIIGLGPNIYFDSILADSFTIIKKAKIVSSCTGSALFEGLLMGKPVITFGDHIIKHFSNDALVSGYQNMEKLYNKLSKAIRIQGKQIQKDFESYLYDVYDQTFGAEKYIGNKNMNMELWREARYEGVVQFFKKFLLELKN